MSHAQGSPLAKVCLATAMCEVNIGDECTVRHPGHHDMPSYSGYIACDGQQAVVEDFIEEKGGISVNIRMKTGPRAGEIVRDVNTRFLRFSGVFKRVAVHTEDESHF